MASTDCAGDGSKRGWPASLNKMPSGSWKAKRFLRLARTPQRFEEDPDGNFQMSNAAASSMDGQTAAAGMDETAANAGIPKTCITNGSSSDGQTAATAGMDKNAEYSPDDWNSTDNMSESSDNQEGFYSMIQPLSLSADMDKGKGKGKDKTERAGIDETAEATSIGETAETAGMDKRQRTKAGVDADENKTAEAAGIGETAEAAGMRQNWQRQRQRIQVEIDADERQYWNDWADRHDEDDEQYWKKIQAEIDADERQYRIRIDKKAATEKCMEENAKAKARMKKKAEENKAAAVKKLGSKLCSSLTSKDEQQYWGEAMADVFTDDNDDAETQGIRPGRIVHN